jgi:hypothetical protein
MQKATMTPFAPRDPRNHPFRFTIITAMVLGPFLSWVMSVVLGDVLFEPWGQPEGVTLRFLGLGSVSGVALGMLIAYLLRKHPKSVLRWIFLSTITVATIMGGLGWVTETAIRIMTTPL